MPLKIYLNVLKIGVYLSFISVFLVFRNLLFPYITSKQIYFNILVEVLMIFWLALIIKYPQVRPFGQAQGRLKKSWVTIGLAGFFGALLASTIFSVDFNLSFWGDIERMLGWFHVVHFFLFYLIIITVFRDWQDWRNLFIVSLVASTIVCLYSLFKIPFSTIGNTAYVSGYAIFNFYFALILFFRFHGQVKNKVEDWLASAPYLAVAFIMILVMKQTHTRGAYIGLGVSFLLFFILSAFYSRSKKLKVYSLAAMVIGIIMVSLIFKYPQSSLVINNSILRTISQISFHEVTFQTRLLSWKAAYKDFRHHPILGTGYGNYSVTFDKYFDPKFYNYTTAETYFDRAHNNLVDIASTGGLISLLAYFFIFGAIGCYLIKGKKEQKISTNEFIALACLFTAYFVQNLTVFDSLVTYISLMIALGYVVWLAGAGEEQEGQPELRGLTNKELGVLIIAGAIFSVIIYQYNVKPLFMLDGTIKGQIKFAQGDILAGVEEYKKALSYKTGLDRDSRASLVNVINVQQADLFKLDKEKAKETVDYAVGLAEANVKLNPLDSMMQMQLAQTLSTASLIYQDNPSKFYFYSDRALDAMEESIKSGPGRVTTYFGKAQIYLLRNDKDNALNTYKYAYSLNENYAEAACYLASVSILLQEESTGYPVMDRCLDLGGASYLNRSDLIKIFLDHYTKNNDQPRILILYQRLSELEPNNTQLWVNMSLLYEQVGKKDQAIGAAKKAMELDHSLTSSAEQFIRKLEGK